MDYARLEVQDRVQFPNSKMKCFVFYDEGTYCCVLQEYHESSQVVAHFCCKALFRDSVSMTDPYGVHEFLAGSI